MKRAIAVFVTVVAIIVIFTGCAKDTGMFGLTKPSQEIDDQATTIPASTEDKIAALQEEFDLWYQKYDSFTNGLSEEYSVFKLITPKYIEQIPDRLGDLVDKYIFPEPSESDPGATEASPQK